MARARTTRRRTFLKTAGAGAALATLAGCIGGNGDDSLRYISRGGTTQDAERELMEQWTEDSGISVEHQEVADDTEMMNVIAENPGEIDFTNPAPWGFTLNEVEFDGELLADIDLGEVPSYEDVISDAWLDPPFTHDGLGGKGTMYYISTQGLAYNTEEVDEITSWQDIKESDLDDQVTLFESGPARFGNSAATLGYDPGEAAADDAMYEEVIEEIRDQDVNVFNYWTTGDEFMRLLREERAYVAEAWGGRVQVLQDDGHPVEYTIPEEGSVTWSNAFAITEESENKEAVYDFLEWFYSDIENIIQVNTSHNYPTPVEDPPEEITALADYVEHPDDLAWIDWQAILPRFEDLEQELAEIMAS